MSIDTTTGYPSLDKPWKKYYKKEAILAPLPERTVYEMIYQSNQQHLADTALIYYGRKISYRELFANIEKAAKALTSIGVCKGDIVIVSSANIPETIYVYYALNRLGAIANMVDPRTDLEGTHRYIAEVNAKLVVCIDAVYPRIIKAVVNTAVKDIVVISPADSLPQPVKTFYRMKNKSVVPSDNTVVWKTFLDNGKDTVVVDAPYKKDTVCTIAHTGGTTGLPKGVMLTNDNINAVTHCYRHLGIPFERGQRYFNDLPPFIMYGLILGVHTTLCYGLQVIVYPIFDSANFPKQFAKYKPHHFSALPDHLRYLIEHKATKDMSLAFLISPGVGGDSLNPQLEETVNQHLKKHGCHYEVCKGYGMTELGATACTSFKGANAIGSVGVPMVANTFKIVDSDTLKECPYNVTGELWISGPSIMSGYYDNPEATKALIHIEPDGTRWVRTGDLGRINEDGLVFHEGRLRRIYLTDYENQPAKIFPQLVEAEIKGVDGIDDCCVVARLRSESACYEAVAFIVCKPSETECKEIIRQLKSKCENALPSYMQPVEYFCIAELPHTPIGKVDFRKLEEMAAGREGT